MEKIKAGKGLTRAKACRQSKNRPYYAKQFYITKTHKETARTKHLKDNPNDLQAQINIKKVRGAWEGQV